MYANLTPEQRAILFTPSKQTVEFLAWCRDFRSRTGASMNEAQAAYQLHKASKK